MNSLSNGSTLKLRNVRHVSKLKRNLISVCQLADGGMKTIFDGDICKIIKGAIVMAYGKKECTLYMTSGFRHQFQLLHQSWMPEWHQRLGHMSEKRMKVMHSKDKLLGSKSIDIDFRVDCVYGKQRRVSFSKVRKAPKTERLELVHTGVCSLSGAHCIL